ncbi:MAG: 3-oxoacyl-[acyl-carrier protein] reductase [Acidimicrobiia bacterium]|jgi:NAD(P)-dependent dehydrogenase (short-subunit alcohol dehydrogenase family)|nr:3-oxoacyl-[acyl-carrier protein] reductase [Acidimicrobiia bacterium]
MDISLDGRNALITGGSAGLGLAMARRFASSGAGVVIVARRAEVLEAAAEMIRREARVPERVHAVPADVRVVEQINEAHREAVGLLGSIDILVNNAGTSATSAFGDISDEAWQADFDLKLFAAIRVMRLVLPDMRSQRWGRIINVLNTAAKAPAAGSAPTAVTRAAGMALTKAVASEVAADNVLVNALCTGLLVSEQWERRYASGADGSSFEEYVAKVGHRVPLGRMGEADEFARLACFLASDAASYVTGTAINIDGGLCPVV